MKQSHSHQEAAAMIGQPPLPMLPADARPIGDAAGVCEDEHGGVVFIWGNAVFAWDAGDGWCPAVRGRPARCYQDRASK